jgi:large subunit ribosomal protein L30
VRVRLRRSLIGHTRDQRRTVWALGLRRVGASRVHVMTPGLQGALRKVQHLVSVEEVDRDQHR